jgi:hypothetical protein
LSHQSQDPAFTEKIRQTLSGSYQFNIKTLFARANQVTKKAMWPLVLAMSVFILITVAAVACLILVIDVSPEQIAVHPAGIFLDLAILLIMSPLAAGLKMLGVSAYKNQGLELKQLFKYMSWLVPLALANLLIMTLTKIGLVLFIVPAIYVYIATIFVLMLIADKKMSVLNAFILSCRVVNKYFLGFAGLMGIFALLAVLTVFTFGLALIWVGPLYYITFGILYVDLFDTPVVDETSSSQTNESVFNA